MQSLNNDCLSEIFSYLKFRDLFSLYEASDSLRAAVKAVWRRRFKRIVINFSDFMLTDEEFGIFLDSIQETVEKLHFRYLPREKYEVFKKYRFGRLHNFKFTMMKPYFLEDEDVPEMQRVMPNLKKFCPHGDFTGIHIANWPHLVDLTLTYCVKVDPVHFSTIIRTLKLEKLKLNLFPNINRFDRMCLQNAQLENLRYLALNTYELNFFVSKPMTALKQLVVTNHFDSREMCDIMTSVWKAKQAILVETANADNVLFNCIDLRFNMEELLVVNDGNPFPSFIIPSVPLLTNLRKLSFKSCPVNTKDFIDLLKNIPQLSEISFESCVFNNANIYLSVHELFPNRKHKLTINMCGNRLADTTGRLAWPQDIDHVIFVYLEIKGSREFLEVTHRSKRSHSSDPLYILFR